jgi:hypothetical protein
MLMKKGISILWIAMSVLLFAITTNNVTAQNATTNASTPVGNAPEPANQTVERGENVSLAVNNTTNISSNRGQNMSTAVGNAPEPANQTVERGDNTSNAMNKTGEAVNATSNELGKNASDLGSTILNKTGEIAKKIIGGVGSVLGNINGEMKKP